MNKELSLADYRKFVKNFKRIGERPDHDGYYHAGPHTLVDYQAIVKLLEKKLEERERNEDFGH